MSERLVLPDADAAADVLTFSGRAAAIGGDAAVRLRAEGGTLVLSTAVLAPESLLDDTPTVLAMRMLRVDPELVCDLVVTAGSLVAGDPSEVVLPPTAITAPWAGISPPRTGWAEAGEVSAAALAARAQWGMTAVAHALPQDPGEDVVRTVRARIWGEADPDIADLPRGIAFAGVTMGFVSGEETVPVRRAGGWSRVSLRRGHLLARRAVRSGLTPVRATGAA